jgi:hypothetical protein
MVSPIDGTAKAGCLTSDENTEQTYHKYSKNKIFYFKKI